MLSYFGVEESLSGPKLIAVAGAIAGHHAGLADLVGGLQEKLKQTKFLSEARALTARASVDSPGLSRTLASLSTVRDVDPGKVPWKYDLYIRMLFSCLVDADRLDSGGNKPIQASLRAEERLVQLYSHLDRLHTMSTEGAVKQMRAEVLQDCLDAATSEARLFSLSVPTGGGKTLAAMAFALRRAAMEPERFRRVIVVIPFLSIIEQNAQVYADIFGPDALLEHHSGSMEKLVERDANHFQPVTDKKDDEEKHFQETGLRSETENWDAPLIVTTSVRFFESLFSNRPSDLRRVHSIARSIVILDEVQTLPRRLLGPLLEMMHELVEDWGVNFVFSTATQPAFERPAHKGSSAKDLRWKPGTMTEIVRRPDRLREALKRVEIQWEIAAPAGWPEVAQRMVAAPHCLAIVNLRDQAAALYEQVLRAAPEAGIASDGIFHLSTRMCAAHRLRVLGKIRERLKADLPCHVVSTQLVEAGVDVDFPLVLRALAPLDAIIQAAGRSDREGKLTAMLGRPGGKVVVFLPEDHRLPPNEYEEAAKITETIARQAEEDLTSIQVDSIDAIQQYFERYYSVDPEDMGEKLLDLRHKLSFATLAENFEMISSRTRDVYVPDDDDGRHAIERLRSPGLTPAYRRILLRGLQRHIVGLSPWEFEKAKGVLERVPSLDGDELWVASFYDDAMGLIFNPGPESFIS